MNKNLKTILNCIGIALLALLIVNLISFGFDLIQNGMGENWYFRFKHGVFYSNDKPAGLIFGSAKANGFMFLIFIIFIIFMFRNFRKGNFSFG